SRNAGRVPRFDALLRHAWSGKKTGNINLVRNFVKKLRTKLGEEAASPHWIFNVRGVGYRMPRPTQEPA
ncbi:MAG: helix-turn-helix domain-containing protein, partial [Spirochaetaceae bacterium]|nr:helix-turn-helix domain-containing protein [Spirochaetaceae bacterium]